MEVRGARGGRGGGVEASGARDGARPGRERRGRDSAVERGVVDAWRVFFMCIHVRVCVGCGD